MFIVFIIILKATHIHQNSWGKSKCECVYVSTVTPTTIYEPDLLFSVEYGYLDPYLC